MTKTSNPGEPSFANQLLALQGIPGGPLALSLLPDSQRIVCRVCPYPPLEPSRDNSLGGNMSWQDLVLTIATVLLSLGLVPAVRSGTHKPPRTTSVISAIATGMLVVVDVSMHFWLTAAVATTSILGWAILAVQAGRLRKSGIRVAGRADSNAPKLVNAAGLNSHGPLTSRGYPHRRHARQSVKRPSSTLRPSELPLVSRRPVNRAG